MSIVRFVMVFQAEAGSRGAREGHCKLVRNRDRKFDRRALRILRNLASRESSSSSSFDKFIYLTQIIQAN